LNQETLQKWANTNQHLPIKNKPNKELKYIKKLSSYKDYSSPPNPSKYNYNQYIENKFFKNHREITL